MHYSVNDKQKGSSILWILVLMAVFGLLVGSARSVMSFDKDRAQISSEYYDEFNQIFSEIMQINLQNELTKINFLSQIYPQPSQSNNSQKNTSIIKDVEKYGAIKCSKDLIDTHDCYLAELTRKIHANNHGQQVLGLMIAKVKAETCQVSEDMLDNQQVESKNNYLSESCANHIKRIYWYET